MPKRKDINELKQWVEENTDCELLSTEYKNVKQKLEFLCGCKEHTFFATWSDFAWAKNKTRKCEYCRNKTMWNIDKIKDWTLNNTNCICLSNEYINTYENLLFLCDCKEHTFEATWNDFKREDKRRQKRSCEYCSGRIKWNIKKIKDFVKDNSGCVLIDGKYENVYSEMTFKCVCGEIFKAKWISFYTQTSQRKCEKCSNHIVWNIDKVRKYAKEYGDTILISDEYINNKEPLEFLCSCKKHTFTTNWATYLNDKKQLCEECSGYTRWDIEKISNYIQENNINCKIISKKYIGLYDKLKFRCDCGEEFKASWNSFLNNNKRCCDKCSFRQSKYERIVEEYLLKNNYNYQKEYRFNDCRGIMKPLPFDFAIFNKDEKISFLIEVDGKQHYEPCSYFGGEKQFLKQKQNDKTKNEYCKYNHIKLIRIPYWEFNDDINMKLNDIFKNQTIQEGEAI